VSCFFNVARQPETTGPLHEYRSGRLGFEPMDVVAVDGIRVDERRWRNYIFVIAIE
jgi:hypothetical protein